MPLQIACVLQLETRYGSMAWRDVDRKGHGQEPAPLVIGRERRHDSEWDGIVVIKQEGECASTDRHDGSHLGDRDSLSKCHASVTCAPAPHLTMAHHGYGRGLSGRLIITPQRRKASLISIPTLPQQSGSTSCSLQPARGHRLGTPMQNPQGGTWDTASGG